MSDTPEAAARTEPKVARGGLSLGRFRGVPVRADGSSLLLLALGGYWYYGFLSPLQGPLGSGVVAVAVVVSALLLFASILLHEIGHAVASMTVGVRVASITLFALGGATHTEETKSPGKEFVVVAGGPLVSFLLAAGFGGLSIALSQSLVASIVCYVLALTNVVLGIFNVVPAYPLDGGRLLRSLLWWVTRKPHWATRTAARTGQALAATIALGALASFTDRVPAELERANIVFSFLFTPSLFNIFIAFFLYRGAAEAHQRAAFLERIGRRSLREVMGSAPPVLAPDMTLDDAGEVLQQRPSLLWPVGDPLQGGLMLSDIQAIPPDQRSTTSTRDIATSADRAAVEVDMPLDEAVARLGNAPGNMLIVTDRGRAVGLVTPSLVADLVR